MLSLSMEIELGWGSVFKSEDAHSQFSGPERKLETKRLNQLLSICEQHEIPFSFDVVGHLLLDECNGHRAPHNDWFKTHDPMGKQSNHPLYYAPDLVKKISNSKTSHEICTHTFSHIPMDEMSDEVISWEINKSKEIHTDSGHPTPTSLVSPQHRETPLETIHKSGISVFRTPRKDGSTVDDYPTQGGLVRRFLWNLNRDPPVAEPEWKNNVLQVYCSNGPSLTSVLLPAGQNSPHPIKTAIPQRIRKRIHRSYLSSALSSASNGNHVHLWCHLWDLANEVQWPLVEEFLHNVGEAKKNGMSVVTLEQLESHY